MSPIVLERLWLWWGASFHNTHHIIKMVLPLLE